MAQDQQQPARLRDRAIPALAEQLERSRARALGTADAVHEVRTDVAIAIVLVGAVCCALGWFVAPVARDADVAGSLYALALATVFWMAALFAAVGLYMRLRRGLFAALVCAMSFLVAVIVNGVLDSSVLGVRWAVELTCAAVFWLAAAGALIVTEGDSHLR